MERMQSETPESRVRFQHERSTSRTARFERQRRRSCRRPKVCLCAGLRPQFFPSFQSRFKQQHRRMSAVTTIIAMDSTRSLNLLLSRKNPAPNPVGSRRSHTRPARTIKSAKPSQRRAHSNSPALALARHTEPKLRAMMCTTGLSCTSPGLTLRDLSYVLLCVAAPEQCTRGDPDDAGLKLLYRGRYTAG
jgi:hypothetical protein